MTFDIIEITEAELKKLDTVKLKLLRTAQQRKDELYHKLEQEIAEQKRLIYSNGMENSTLLTQITASLTAEYEYQVEILREQMLFNMSLGEPTLGQEMGPTGNNGSSGYIVNYELSYMERYIEVRDYYLTIEDPNERIQILRQDQVARQYLGTYYNTLFNYLVQFTQGT